MTLARILLVDDQTLFRKSIGRILAAEPDFELVGEASDGLQAIEKATELMPDIILMDINMPRLDGLEACRRIKREMPYVKLVMLTVADEDKPLFEALKAGASGYLLKDILPDQLVAYLRGVLRGEAPISGAMAARILQEFALSGRPSETGKEPGQPAPESLTPREREVLQLVARGQTNREIAEALFLSEHTVRNHLRNILDKLHLANRVQAAAYAIREGLADEPERKS